MPELPTESVQPANDTTRFIEAQDLVTVRAFVRASAVTLGLPAHRADLLALAVSELTTNTLQYTSGGGLVRVWAQAGQVVCDVVDTGPTRSAGDMPPAESVRGRGLAIVDRIVDEVATTTVPDGTLVRIRMNL
jgi:anti-sigma regulatory factor (Ser/Thr protein kinase)